MKRGRKFLENDNLLIYGGIAVFAILAVAIGIIMYMTSKSKNEENIGNPVEQSQTVEESTESASTDIGKTVEEQEGNLLKENTTATTNYEYLEYDECSSILTNFFKELRNKKRNSV